MVVAHRRYCRTLHHACTVQKNKQVLFAIWFQSPGGRALYLISMCPIHIFKLDTPELLLNICQAKTDSINPLISGGAMVSKAHGPSHLKNMTPPQAITRDSSQLDPTKTVRYVDRFFEESVLDELSEFIKIPNKSPAFDKQWESNGYMHQATQRFADWARGALGEMAQVDEIYVKGRTPLLLIDVPGTSANHDTVLMYGHLDKQPEMTGWDADKGPWTPVREGDRLFGRGSSDDGYAMFSAITAIKALKEQGVGHHRCLVLIEACEESGSLDLPFYLESYKDKIGDPSLIICLDSGCGNYDQLWCTSSLRGVVGGTLTAQVLEQGVHSGAAGGLVPDSFSVIRSMLDRLENAETGDLKPRDLHVTIPEKRKEEAVAVASAAVADICESLPLTQGVCPISQDKVDQILRNTWEPSLAITGADHMPSIRDAGNVLRPKTSVKLSMRIPPTLDPALAMSTLKETLESHPPFRTKVSLTDLEGAPGWDAPITAPWLDNALREASHSYFGETYLSTGEGGSIPFMATLAQKFPEAQFMITGVLGPKANAHGPNEFLDIPTAKKLTSSVAHVLHKHHERFQYVEG